MNGNGKSIIKPWFRPVAAIIILLFAVSVMAFINGRNEETDKEINKEQIVSIDENRPAETITKNEGSHIVFDKSKVQGDYLETVLVKDCTARDGPGENYRMVENLKYGDIVIITGKYEDWVRCSVQDGKQDLWVRSTDCITEKLQTDYNLGVITAGEVNVGQVTLKKGNLIQVLIRNKDKSCVTVRVIDVNGGKTGWISNSDYTEAGKGVYYNQAYLKKRTVIYEEPSDNAQEVNDNWARDNELFVNIDQEKDGWVKIYTYGPIMGWVRKENIFIPMSFPAISPDISGELKVKLQGSIASMLDMEPGVGPWRIITCIKDRIILYNYAYVVACDISEKNRGIYSIIELSGLKVGSYQGSEIAEIFPGPDAMSCVIGTGSWEKDIKSTKSLYLCNFNDSSVKELEENYNLANREVTWYMNMPGSTNLPWFVSIKGKDSESVWDVYTAKKLDTLPPGARIRTTEDKFLENVDFDTGYNYMYWWKADENTVIGAPYSNSADSAAGLKLGDFEIIKVDLKDKSAKVLFRMVN